MSFFHPIAEILFPFAPEPVHCYYLKELRQILKEAVHLIGIRVVY